MVGRYPMESGHRVDITKPSLMIPFSEMALSLSSPSGQLITALRNVFRSGYLAPSGWAALRRVCGVAPKVRRKLRRIRSRSPKAAGVPTRPRYKVKRIRF
jgi:hypothetical protein